MRVAECYPDRLHPCHRLDRQQASRPPSRLHHERVRLKASNSADLPSGRRRKTCVRPATDNRGRLPPGDLIYSRASPPVAPRDRQSLGPQSEGHALQFHSAKQLRVRGHDDG
jgi:hypothetical protein